MCNRTVVPIRWPCARRQGHIVIVSSLHGRRTLPGDGPYAIAKAALARLAQVLRQELRPCGVGVTGVSPAGSTRP